MADDDFTMTNLTVYGEQVEGVADSLASALGLEPANIEVKPMSEHHFLYGDAPHPATHAHTQAVVDRIHALTPTPSLVRMDRGEALIEAAVAWRNLELGGQHETQQWCDAIGYIRDVTDRYIEATS